MVHEYITICLLRFWRLFLQNVCHLYFCGLIWSENLKFSKLTEIWYRDILLYTYYDFTAYFFKIFVNHNFLGKFGLKIWSFPNWLKFSAAVHYYMFITILMFIFSKVSSFKNLMLSLVFSKLTKSHCDMLITNLIFSFSIFS